MPNMHKVCYPVWKNTPHCVPSDAVAPSVTVNICHLCVFILVQDIIPQHTKSGCKK